MKRPLAIAITIMGMAGAALAHGDAAWIMVDPQYVRTDNVHCCGPTDCRRLAADEVTSDGPGAWIFKATGQRFQQGDKAVYPAIRPGFWACEREGRVVCFFFEGGAS